MDLTTITATNFKALFVRDFPYLKTWSATDTYDVDDEVYYSVNGKFYKCLVDGTTTTLPTDVSVWQKISDNALDYVSDTDIENAMVEATGLLNQGLFPSDELITRGYLLLTAHCMSLDLRAAKDGMNSIDTNAVASRGVGSVSESYAVPEEYTKNTNFAYYIKTAYGVKYLNMIMPYLRGNVEVAGGWTQS